ncbi:MAG: hypothetical protein IKR85_01990 [Clostridia bacterium]|nr:hypothetical protein [Clostridia bacterium]
MKKIVLIVLLVCMSVFSLAEDLFGDVDGMLILDPDAVGGEVTVSVRDALLTGANAQEQSARLVVTVSVFNGTVNTYTPEDVSARLTYMDVYEYAGTADLSAQLGALVKREFHVMFDLPLYAAAGAAGAPKLTVSVGETDAVLDISVINPQLAALQTEADFTYAGRISPYADLAFGELTALENAGSAWMGFEQDVLLFNWSAEPQSFAGQLSLTLVYLGRYSFEAEIEADAAPVKPLSCASVKAKIRVPKIAAEDEYDNFSANVTLCGSTAALEYSLD